MQYTRHTQERLHNYTVLLTSNVGIILSQYASEHTHTHTHTHTHNSKAWDGKSSAQHSGEEWRDQTATETAFWLGERQTHWASQAETWGKQTLETVFNLGVYVQHSHYITTGPFPNIVYEKQYDAKLLKLQKQTSKAQTTPSSSSVNNDIFRRVLICTLHKKTHIHASYSATHAC